MENLSKIKFLTMKYRAQCNESIQQHDRDMALFYSKKNILTDHILGILKITGIKYKESIQKFISNFREFINIYSVSCDEYEVADDCLYDIIFELDHDDNTVEITEKDFDLDIDVDDIAETITGGDDE